jgi:hypothetical protein
MPNAYQIRSTHCRHHRVCRATRVRSLAGTRLLQAKAPWSPMRSRLSNLTREAITHYFNSTLVFPDDCYALSTEKRAGGNYVVQMSERPGQKCEVADYGRAFSPFSVEIDAMRGSAVVVGYPGVQVKPREVKLFPLEDVPGLPPNGNPTQWSLQGDAKQQAHTRQCDLSIIEIPFEQRNGSGVGLHTSREHRTLAVAYSVNAFYPTPLPDGARVALVFEADQVTLGSYEATIDVRPRRAGQGPITSNDASFTLIWTNERRAPSWVCWGNPRRWCPTSIRSRAPILAFTSARPEAIATTIAS